MEALPGRKWAVAVRGGRTRARTRVDARRQIDDSALYHHGMAHASVERIAALLDELESWLGRDEGPPGTLALRILYEVMGGDGEGGGMDARDLPAHMAMMLAQRQRMHALLVRARERGWF